MQFNIDGRQPNIDKRQPFQQTTGSAEPMHPWNLGLMAVANGRSATQGGRPDSFFAECECPEDCLRDHENE